MSDTRVLKQLFSAYANSQVTVETIAVYDRLLSDIPPTDLQTVIDQCVAECKFLPTVAEIRERWHALTRTIGVPTATEAWGEVQAEIRRVGYIGTPTFANFFTTQVVKMIGWRDLCASENVIADRAHFMKMYDQLIERGEQVNRLLPQALTMAQGRVGTSGMKRIGDVLKLPEMRSR
jgi:hypothetical protein